MFSTECEEFRVLIPRPSTTLSHLAYLSISIASAI